MKKVWGFKCSTNLSLCCPLQARLCMAGCCGTRSRTWTQPTNCSWRRFTSAPAGTDTFPSSTPRGRCTTRGRSMAASSPTSTSNIASYCWYKYMCFLFLYSGLRHMFKERYSKCMVCLPTSGWILPWSLLNIKYQHIEDSDCVTTQELWCSDKNWFYIIAEGLYKQEGNRRVHSHMWVSHFNKNTVFNHFFKILVGSTLSCYWKSTLPAVVSQ